MTAVPRRVAGARAAWLAASVMFCVLAQPVSAQQPGEDLLEASLEDLLNVKVTSVSKKEQALFQTPSAIFVLTADDISRSGATSIAEVLRMVPGVSVGRLSGSAWRVGIRGFSAQYADKVLVLVDGMSVYDPIFGGVSWGTFEPSLEAIARIEVIRGPGASVWGANAVNGVVNIITKEARATQGTRVTLTAGSVAGSTMELRHGGTVGSTGHFRVEVGGALTNRLQSPGASGPHVQRHLGTGAFRMDLQSSASDRWQIQALATVDDHFETGTVADLTARGLARGFAEFEPSRFGSGMAQWIRESRPGLTTSLRMYGLHNVGGGAKSVTRSGVAGAELQRRLRAGRHDVIVNADVRRTFDAERDGPTATFTPARHWGYQVSAFLQDEMALVPATVALTVGAKVGDTDLSRADVNPNVRLSWTPSSRSTVWLSAARAERTPGRYQLDAALLFPAGGLPDGTPALFEVRSSRRLRSEHVEAYEGGYRARSRFAAVEASAFTNRYSGLITPASRGMAFSAVPQTHVRLISEFLNASRLTTFGLELAARAHAGTRLDLDGSYSWLHASAGVTSALYSFGSPAHSAVIGATVTPGRAWEVGGRLYLVGGTPGRLGHYLPLEPYQRLDIRLARTVGGASIGLTGQNLLAPGHMEGDGTPFRPTPLPRSVHATLTWQF